jgi:excisionase family DNA binding protein
MTAEEAAAYLRISRATVYKLTRDGEIPAMQIGSQWRFRRDLIDEWLREQSLGTGREDTPSASTCPGEKAS